MNPDDFANTVQIPLDYGIIKKRIAPDLAYRADLAEAAVAELEEDGEDVNGEDWEKPEVEVTPVACRSERLEGRDAPRPGRSNRG